jgi:Ca-activated chloride channel family protein
MKLTPLGKITILLVAVGLAVGGWRLWTTKSGTILKKPGTTASTSKESLPNSEASAGEIVLMTNPGKKGWLDEQVEAFNASGASPIKVKMRFIATREAMHAVIDGKEQPALWSPSSVIWADRLTEVWSQKHSGALIDTSDPTSYRTVLRSPMVFLTTRSKAAFLRPLLSSPNSWRNIRDLALGKKKAPWGKVRWAHSDPLNANSGMLTLALILADYAQQTGQSAAIEKLANSEGFKTYLKELERNIVYDTAVEKGTTALTKSFAEDPSRYDFITTYESSALSAADKDPDLAVIYPSPTALADSAVAALNADWLSEEQKAAAKQFLDFLASKPSVAAGVKTNFRPAASSGGVNLNSKLQQMGGQGFQQSYSSIELPPYEALNSAAFTWRVEIAHKSPND